MPQHENYNPTMLDIIGKENDYRPYAECLVEFNPFLKDGTFIKCNMKDMHKAEVRTGLPNEQFNKVTHLGEGKIFETTCIESSHSVDTGIIDKIKGGNEMSDRIAKDLYRKKKPSYCCEALLTLSQKFDKYVLCGDKRTGSMSYYYENADTSTGDKRPFILFVGWHPETCYFAYPEGTIAGFERKDLGKVHTGHMGYTSVYLEEFFLRVGLVISDWGYVKIFDIDATLLNSNDPTRYRKLLGEMLAAQETMKRPAGVRPAIYSSRRVKSCMESILRTQPSKTGSFVRKWINRKIVEETWNEIPWHTPDQMRNTEKGEIQ